jgi:hypothetical protein
MIFVAQRKAIGHDKIKGPIICSDCYSKEFGSTNDVLPSSYMIQPEEADAPIGMLEYYSAFVEMEYLRQYADRPLEITPAEMLTHGRNPDSKGVWEWMKWRRQAQRGKFVGR